MPRRWLEERLALKRFLKNNKIIICITGKTAEPSLIKRSWDKNLESIQISHWKEGIDLHQVDFFFIDEGLVVQKVDNAIQWIVQSVLLMTYPLDSDLSDG